MSNLDKLIEDAEKKVKETDWSNKKLSLADKLSAYSYYYNLICMKLEALIEKERKNEQDSKNII